MFFEQKPNLFRKEALERLSSPERLDQVVRIVSPKDWLFLCCLGGIVLLAFAWSIWGRLPTAVTGTGVLIRPHQIVDVQAPASGRLLAFNFHAGDPIKPGDVLGTIDQVEIRTLLQQAQSRLHELQLQDHEKSLLQERQTLEQKQELEAAKRILELQTQHREKSIRDAEALGLILKKRLDGLQQLKVQGLISAISSDLIQAEQQFGENELKISESRAEIKELESHYKDVEIKGEKLAQENLEVSTARRNEIRSLDSQIALLEVQLQRNSQIINERAGQILEVVANTGQLVQAGNRLGSIELQGSAGATVCVSYFAIRDGKRISVGMPILITPDTVKRERFGGIQGTVSSVSQYPVTKEGATAFIGSTELATRLLGDEPRIEVVAELKQDPTSFSGYKWSSSNGPPLRISSGTTTSSRVTVEARAPITFLLPFLRSASGIN